MSAAFFRSLAKDAASRYPARDPFARRFGFGKLNGDPAFRYLLEHGLIADGARLLDLGCGQGVLAALLASAAERHAEGTWPQGWPAPPRLGVMRGIDLMARDVERARVAAGAMATFTCADIRAADFGDVDTVVILDVLHYIDFAAQVEVLERIRAAFGGAGTLLLRVGDQSKGLRFRYTDFIDRMVMALRGHRFARLYTRPLAEWRAELERLGFRVEAVPMSAGTPFANVLLLARYDSPSQGQS